MQWGPASCCDKQFRCPFLRPTIASKVESMTTPQQLSREAIDEFRAIYQEEFDRILTDDEVQEIAIRLLRFFGILHDSDSAADSDQRDH
jgi:hypothetical protein